MSLPIIENILYKAMGLNTASIGSSSVMRAVEQRMSECHINNIDNYTAEIVRNKNELQELIEEVVVAETWFFRDTRPFEMLTRYVKNEWLLNEKDKPIRILSLPCATGEEPYSIAITLIEAGLMPSMLRIDAFDISERNIKRCKTARYREHSFRAVDPYLRDRFFNLDNDNYYPDILIKAMVNFEVASILDPVFIRTQIPYDVVFCRNLLIYFDRATQNNAKEMLGKLLNPNGLLFVGHAETSIFTNDWHLSQRYQKSFIVRKIADGPQVKKRIKNTTAKLGSSGRPLDNIGLKTASNKPAVISSLRHKSSTNENSLISLKSSKQRELPSINQLSKAKEFADCGRLVEAETICVSYLEDNKHDKEVYYLLAIIQLALGDEQKSLQYFKSVIYLDPKHYDSLMYLSTLLGEEGDEIGATRFRERASRIKARIAYQGNRV